MLGGLGGGEAGGGTCTGLGGRGLDIRGLVTAGGLDKTLSFWPLIPATETLPEKKLTNLIKLSKTVKSQSILVRVQEHRLVRSNDVIHARPIMEQSLTTYPCS